MSPRRPRDIGTVAESAVVRALHGLGFPHAERRQLRGIHDAGDITGTLGVCWSVKGGVAAKTASDGLVGHWLVELGRQQVNAEADVGVLVLQRAGIGVANAGRWWAVLDTRTLAWLTFAGQFQDYDAPQVPVRLQVAGVCSLLRFAGYGGTDRADHPTWVVDKPARVFPVAVRESDGPGASPGTSGDPQGSEAAQGRSGGTL